VEEEGREAEGNSHWSQAKGRERQSERLRGRRGGEKGFSSFLPSFPSPVFISAREAIENTEFSLLRS